jgi:hypothetical protein
MTQKFFKVLSAFVLTAGIFSCSKSKDSTTVQPPPPVQFQSLTFKFGTDSTAISIDNAVKVVKNLPHSCNAAQLVAAAVLPTGYSISPSPATAQDYTKGITYTVTNDKGQKYTVQITAPAYDSVSNPYGIYTPKHLSDMRNGLSYSYVLMNDIQLPDITSSNAAASTGISDYNQFGWYSIGTKYLNGGNVVFRGSLDGQNHVIKNLTSLYRSGNAMPVGIDTGRHAYKGTDGLFGWAVGATFKNIGIQLAATGINDFSTTGDGYGYVGSLVGSADSSTTVTNCYVTGNATVGGIQHTGGLIGGIKNSTISKCYVALTTTAGNYAIMSGSDDGGLIGSANLCSISNSYASCSILGAVNAGGLIGSINSCSVKSSYALGNIAEIPSNSVSSLTAPDILGGLIGSASAQSSTSPSTIQNCFSTGAVAGANGTNSSFHMNSRIGGLIGQVQTTSGPVSVTNCYAAGPVTRFWTSASAPYFTGALCGNTPNGVFITSAVCTNYWDKTTTTQTNLGGADGTLAQDNAFTTNGKTTAEMKTAATFSNWDFSSVWNVASGTNNGYPYLRSAQ